MSDRLRETTTREHIHNTQHDTQINDNHQKESSLMECNSYNTE